jgi:hypothetical protein
MAPDRQVIVVNPASSQWVLPTRNESYRLVNLSARITQVDPLSTSTNPVQIGLSVVLTGTEYTEPVFNYFNQAMTRAPTAPIIGVIQLGCGMQRSEVAGDDMFTQSVIIDSLPDDLIITTAMVVTLFVVNNVLVTLPLMATIEPMVPRDS